MKVPPLIDAELLTFVEGYKKTVSTLKSQGKYELAEGKKYIKESSYTELLKIFAMFCPTSAVPHLKHLFYCQLLLLIPS